MPNLTDICDEWQNISHAPNGDYISDKTTVFPIMGDIAKTYLWYICFPAVVCLTYVILMLFIFFWPKKENIWCGGCEVETPTLWVWNLLASFVTLYYSYRIFQYIDRSFGLYGFVFCRSKVQKNTYFFLFSHPFL